MAFRRLGLCLGLLVVAAAPNAFATQARIDSMGGGPKYWTIEDETNIFDFPSLLVRYGNQTYVDDLKGGFANTRFGFHYSLSDDFVLGVYGGLVNSGTRPVADPTDPSESFDVGGNTFTGSHSLGVGKVAGTADFAQGPVEPLPGAVSDVDLKIGLLLAMNLGSTMRLGFMLNILGDNADVEQPAGTKIDQGATLVDFGGGIGVDLAGSELELGLGIEFGTAEDFRDARNNPQSDLSGNEIQGELLEHWSVASHLGLRLNARWTFDFVDQSNLVLYARLHTMSQEVTRFNMNLIPANQFPQAQTGLWSGTDFVVGADLRLNPFEDVIVAPGLGIRYAQVSLSGTHFNGDDANIEQIDRDVDRLVSFPFYGVGVDVKVFDWCDYRFGAFQSVDFERASVTAGGITSEQRISHVQTHVATGVGVELPVAESLLTFDLNVNPLWWLNGPDAFTGNGSNTTFGVTGSIKYDW